MLLSEALKDRAQALWTDLKGTEARKAKKTYTKRSAEAKKAKKAHKEAKVGRAQGKVTYQTLGGHASRRKATKTMKKTAGETMRKSVGRTRLARGGVGGALVGGALIGHGAIKARREKKWQQKYAAMRAAQERAAVLQPRRPETLRISESLLLRDNLAE